MQRPHPFHTVRRLAWVIPCLLSLTPPVHAISLTDTADSTPLNGAQMNKAGSQTRLEASTGVLQPGEALTLTVTVSGKQPSGYVTLLEGKSVIAGDRLVNGSIRFERGDLKKGTLTVGTHHFTARYEGDAANESSQSATVSLTVEGTPQAALIVTASPMSITQCDHAILNTQGGSGSGKVSYTAVGSGDLSCSVQGARLTASGAGRCTITATKASDETYYPIQSAPIDVTVTAKKCGNGFTLTNWSKHKPDLHDDENTQYLTPVANGEDLWVGLGNGAARLHQHLREPDSWSASTAFSGNVAEGLLFSNGQTSLGATSFNGLLDSDETHLIDESDASHALDMQWRLRDFAAHLALSDQWAVVAAPSTKLESLQAAGAPMDVPGWGVGAAFVFQKQANGTWKQVARLHVPVEVLNDALKGGQAFFGGAVALSGHWLAIGAPGYQPPLDAVQGSGRVYLYKLDSADHPYQPKKILSAPEGVEGFGRSVAIAGDRLVIGGNELTDDGVRSAIYGYRYSQLQWQAQSRTQLPLPTLAQCEGTVSAPCEEFGQSMAMLNNTLAVSAPLATVKHGSDSYNQAGRVFVYSWDEQANRYNLNATSLKLTTAQLKEAAYFGSSLGIAERGYALLVGAPNANNDHYQEDQQAGKPENQRRGSGAGRAFLYQFREGQWKIVQNFQGGDDEHYLGDGVALLPKAAFVSNNSGRLWIRRAY